MDEFERNDPPLVILITCQCQSLPAIRSQAMRAWWPAKARRSCNRSNGMTDQPASTRSLTPCCRSRRAEDCRPASGLKFELCEMVHLARAGCDDCRRFRRLFLIRCFRFSSLIFFRFLVTTNRSTFLHIRLRFRAANDQQQNNDEDDERRSMLHDAHGTVEDSRPVCKPKAHRRSR